MKTKISTAILAFLGFTLSVSPCFAQDAIPERATPGANLGANSSPNNPAGNTGASGLLSLGEYVELDDSIRNEMYGTIDFPNADLKDIIKAISKMANKNFILDRKIENRKITIISPNQITKQEAYNAFLSALYMNDLTVVSMGRFLKVIEAKNATQSNIRVFMGDHAPASEEIVTLLYPLKHLNAEEIQRFVTDLVPRNGRVASYPNTNTLVLTDTGLNLRRIASILKGIDVPGHEDQLESIPIRYADAKGIASLIESILDAQGGSRARAGGARPAGNRGQAQKTRGGGIISKIVPDERTNALVVLANGRGIQELKSLVSKLDTPDAAGGGNIHVYYCKNASAKDLAATIEKLISTNNRGTQQTRPGQPNNPNIPPINPGQGQQGGESIRFEGNIKVTNDDATNSLVVIASGSDYAALKAVLQRLDIPRRQVYVEATIAEISVADSSSFGAGVNIAENGIGQLGGFIDGQVIDSKTLTSLVSTAGGVTGLVAGFTAGKKVNVAGIGEISSVSGLLRALQTSNQANILHQPQILTSDNEKADISIKQKVPAGKTSTVVSGTTPTTSETVQFEDLTTKLIITPQLGRNSDLVKLKVEQTYDDFEPSSTPDGSTKSISTTSRTTTTVVTARSGDTVAIGGLQSVRWEDTNGKFPLLGDLPLIGVFFRSFAKKMTRKNLIVFLTPRIINEYSDLIKLTNSQIEKRQDLGQGLYNPPDRTEKEIKQLRAKVRDDLKKPTPDGWGFAPRNQTPSNQEKDAEAEPQESKSSFIRTETPELSENEETPEGLLNTPEPEGEEMEMGRFASPSDKPESADESVAKPKVR